MPFIEMIRVSLRPMSHLMTADFSWWSEDFSLQAYRDMWNTVPLLGRLHLQLDLRGLRRDGDYDDRRHPRRLRLCPARLPLQGAVIGRLPCRQHVHRSGPSDPALPGAALALASEHLLGDDHPRRGLPDPDRHLASPLLPGKDPSRNSKKPPTSTAPRAFTPCAAW